MENEAYNNVPTAEAPAAAQVQKKSGGVKKAFKVLGCVLLAVVLLAVICAVILFTVFMLGGSSLSSKSYSVAVDLDKDEQKIIDRYIDAVNTAKESGDFSLSVETASEVKDIECSLSLFQRIINSLIESMDMGYTASESYVFEDGADAQNDGATPLSVIQPAGVLIEEKSYSGISAVSSSTVGDSETIAFTVAAESIDMQELMELLGFDEMMDMTIEERQALAEDMADEYDVDMENPEGFDLSADDIRDMEEYQTFIALVPNHTQYFDVLSAVYSVMNAFSFDDMQSGENTEGFGFFGGGSGEQSEEAEEYMQQYAENSGGDMENMFAFGGGTITFGDMQITAVLTDGEVQSIAISVDFVMDMDVTLMGKAVELSYTAALSQQYTFS